MKVYHYKNCSTCKKALKFLKDNNVSYEEFHIEINPPSEIELKGALENYGNNIKKLFNTSGKVYREMGLGEKLKTMSEAEALKLLSENGMLVKRPFVVSKGENLVGFKIDDWEQKLV